MADEQAARWAEDDSEDFIGLGDVITPSRREQIEMLVSLVPAQADDAFLAVDLSCGAGSLSVGLLERFPACRVIGLDFSQRMLDEAAKQLARFGERVEFRRFDLFERDWLAALPTPVRCFVSSLAIHHLDGEQKRRLFRDLCDQLEPGGALLIIDLVDPVNDIAWASYAAAWDAAVREQTAELAHGAEIYAQFRDGWNHYATPDLEFDKPSGLFEQLQWLREAGFGAVDCFWLRAGHALYGGYKG